MATQKRPLVGIEPALRRIPYRAVEYMCIVPYYATRAKFLKRRVHTEKTAVLKKLATFQKNIKKCRTTRYIAKRMRENDSVACDATRQMHF